MAERGRSLLQGTITLSLSTQPNHSLTSHMKKFKTLNTSITAFCNIV
jgi:hypothetical protein